MHNHACEAFSVEHTAPYNPPFVGCQTIECTCFRNLLPPALHCVGISFSRKFGHDEPSSLAITSQQHWKRHFNSSTGSGSPESCKPSIFNPRLVIAASFRCNNSWHKHCTLLCVRGKLNLGKVFPPTRARFPPGYLRKVLLFSFLSLLFGTQSEEQQQFRKVEGCFKPS